MCLFDLNAFSSRSDKGETVAGYLQKRRAIENYVDINTSFAPLNLVFQNNFSKFYGLNAALQMNKVNFYNVFDEYYNHKKSVSYRNILEDLKNPLTGTGRVETSFASKLLHTIDNDEPIIDSEVVKKLSLCFCTSKYFISIRKKPKTIDQAVDLYNALKACYFDYLLPLAKKSNYFAVFDALFPSLQRISDVKKIDFYIWAM